MSIPNVNLFQEYLSLRERRTKSINQKLSNIPIGRTFDRFVSEIRDSSYATKFKYELEFLFPEGLFFDPKIVESIGNFKCIEAEFPQKNVDTFDYRYYGPKRKHPFNTHYEEVSFTILCTENHLERKLFEEYFQRAFDNRYNLNYVDDIKCNVKVFQLNLAETAKTAEIELMDCVPVSLDAMTLNYASQNEPQTFIVRLNFRDYKMKEINY